MNTIILNATPTGYNVPFMIMIGLCFAVMYFFIILPKNKRIKFEQEREKIFRSELKKGDQIITLGGIHGKIIEVKESSVILENYGVKIKVEKSAIAMNAVSEQLS